MAGGKEEPACASSDELKWMARDDIVSHYPMVFHFMLANKNEFPAYGPIVYEQKQLTEY